MDNTTTQTNECVKIGKVDMDVNFKYRKDGIIPEGDAAILLKISKLSDETTALRIGQGNVIKLMVRFLKHAIVNFEARLASIHGGTCRDQIPQECSAMITVPAEIIDELLDEVSYYNELYHSEYGEIRFMAKTIDLPESLVPEEIQDDVVNSVEACFDGVFRIMPNPPYSVETYSTLTMLNTDSEETHAVFMICSTDEEQKRYLASTLQSTFLLGGAKVSFLNNE